MFFSFIYLFLILLMSFITLVVYGTDKRKAVRGQSRVPEKVLFALSFFGGSVGSLFGMVLFSHKTKHTYFWVLNILFLLIQIALLIAIIFIEIKFLW